MVKIEELDKQGYRKFGLTTAAIVGVLFGGLIPWIFSFAWPVWPWYIVGALAGSALVLPMALKPVYALWMRFGLMMNWINTRLILGILFYGMFLPIGLVFKLFGKDPMRRKLDVTKDSYREHGSLETKKSLETPY